MPLSPGEQLGNYKIDSLLGKGGMGEVYLATDTRLGRPVAVKVSSREFNDRFEREARAISTLNHPNICTLYDVGPNYLVMELIEGETLSKLIERGPLPLDKALAYAIQIVDALAAAHAKGVIHRDLKPGNIIITPNGVKVLDFGLAKLSTDKHAAADSAVQTITEPLTRPGTVLGTLFYMAPEQVEGKDADERSDIFSFGVVFYEMLTGQRPFTGDTQAAVLAAILKDQPAPISQRQPAIPRALDRVVRKCLEKKPDDRWHSARDLKPTLELIDLDAPSLSSASASASASVPLPIPPPAPEKSKPKSWLWPALAGVLALIVAAGAAYEFWPKPKSTDRATRFQITLPPNVSFYEYLSVSPDGHKVVFTSNTGDGGLWIHDLDSLSWHELPDTKGAVSPFWSPDSRFLGFGVGAELKKIEIAGGPPQTLATASRAAGSGAWSKDGVILFGERGVRGAPLWRVSSSGGIPTPVTAVDPKRGEGFHALPSFLPDGKHFVYLTVATPEIRGIYVGSLDAKPAEQSKERILATQYAAPYVDGNLFFVRDGTLMTQPFDEKKLQLTGDPIPVAEHVGAEQSAAWFSVSPTGVLAYRAGPQSTAGIYRLTWLDEHGQRTGTVGEPQPDQGFTISPDATRVGMRDAAQNAPGDIWLLEFTRGVRTRITFRQSAGSFPVWSPDGKTLAFSAGPNVPDVIYTKSSSGAGAEKEEFKMPTFPLLPTSWSRDGRFLLFTVVDPKSRNDLWVLSLQGPAAGKAVPLLATDFNESAARFSPDGRWIAYQSNESGRAEVYVRPFDPSGPASVPSSGPGLGQGKWQISRDGGQNPHWRSDGKQILYTAPNSAAPITVDVTASPAAIQAGAPLQLFPAPPGVVTGWWDAAPDFKRFLFALPPATDGSNNQPEPITVVLNWKASLKH